MARPAPDARARVRRQLGIPEEAIVFGLVGRIIWDAGHEFCYGLDLIRAVKRTDRDDVYVVIVGGGDGLPRLAEAAGSELGRRIRLTGECPAQEVMDHLAAMDIGALSQSTDVVGSMRYTTKLPEYLVAGLPVLATETPMAYDLDGGWLWRVAGEAPWDERQVDSIAALMKNVTTEDVAQRRARLPREPELFDPERQRARVASFVREATGRARLGRRSS